MASNSTTFKKGHKHSLEVIAKISATKKGKSFTTSSSFKKGMIPWNKAKKTGIKPICGFKKGIIPWNKGMISPFSNENELQRKRLDYILWRTEVYQRDDFTCKKYGTKGGKLHAHHIHNFADFPELRTVVSNGITLSEKAHKEFHKKYGRKNNTEEQLLDYLNNHNG